MAVLANLFALPASDRYRLQELSPQKRKEKTLAALLAQLDGLAARQPVFVIFEDIHWIDPTSLELLAAAVEHVPQLRVLLLVTARPEFTPPWPSDPHMMTIPLTRLDRRDGAALVERVTGGKTLPKEVMDEILARTDGVPLFIEELTKTVLESELLQERNGHYVLERPLPSMAIPTTLHASLMARLDRLAPVREVAQIGAVAGRDFHYELLKAVAGLPRERLDEALGQLVRAELIFRRGEIPHAVYTFKHALVRDAAYAGLLKSRRVHLHAAIANALEQQFPEIVQTQPETLAHHLTEAGLIEKAIGYWLQAGKNAALRSANLEAIAHLQRGIEGTGRLPAGEGKDRSELDLQLVLGPCLIATQGPAASKAVATFARARELCERLGEPPEYLQVMFWLATVSVVRGELPQALEAVAALTERRRSARRSAGVDQRDTRTGDDSLLSWDASSRPAKRSNALSRCSTQVRKPTEWLLGQPARTPEWPCWPSCRGCSGFSAMSTGRSPEWLPRLSAPTRSTMRTRTLTPGTMRLFCTLCAASRQLRRPTRSAVSPYRSSTDSASGSGCRARSGASARPCWMHQAADSTR